MIIHMNFPRDLSERWTRKDAFTLSSFRLLQDKAGVLVQSSFTTIRASLATAKTAGALRVLKGSPVLELQRVRVSSGQGPVEYAVIFFPGESYELTATISAAVKNGLKLDRR